MKICILNGWKVLEATSIFFLFKFNFLEFCDNFVPDFENLYYFLHLDTIDGTNKSSSEKSKSKPDCSKNSCKNECLETGNGNSEVRNWENIEGEINANAVLLEKR